MLVLRGENDSEEQIREGERERVELSYGSKVQGGREAETQTKRTLRSCPGSPQKMCEAGVLRVNTSDRIKL